LSNLFIPFIHFISACAVFFLLVDTKGISHPYQVENFSSFFSRLSHDLTALNRFCARKNEENKIFLHFSLACPTI